MKVGYARVSTYDQNLDMQIDALEKYGCEVIYKEKVSGARRDRPELDRMMGYLRPGDTVVVYKLDRISRSTRHLIELSERFEETGVDFVSVNDNIDTTTAMGKFFFSILAAQAQLERDVISERTKSGLEAARARGRKGGRPKTDPRKIEQALKMYDAKTFTISEIEEATGVSRRTLYRRLREREGGGRPEGANAES